MFTHWKLVVYKDYLMSNQQVKQHEKCLLPCCVNRIVVPQQAFLQLEQLILSTREDSTLVGSAVAHMWSVDITPRGIALI